MIFSDTVILPRLETTECRLDVVCGTMYLQFKRTYLFIQSGGDQYPVFSRRHIDPYAPRGGWNSIIIPVTSLTQSRGVLRRLVTS
jgi:hypothetical protein